jgi:hypothetical protein
MIAIYLLLSSLFVGAQNAAKIHFTNPSFEDTPRQNAFPAGWSSGTVDCTPDIMPGAWGLKCPPQQGKTCVGLVTREDGTREDLGQMVSGTLKKDSCYTFTIYLAHAAKYVGYDQPLRLRVWGGARKGAKEQLLDSSPLIDHPEWRQYKFQFTPSKDLQYLSFEAYFAPGVLYKYKGNILLDNCSVIDRCDRA